jgi:hypothetical protein
MMRTLPLLAITGALTVLSGYVHGLWTGRWGDPRELELAVARLQLVPLKIGDWDGQDEQIDPREVKQAGFRGHLRRKYTNRVSGAKVSITLACGLPGPLSVHTPEHCYRGLGFRQVSPSDKFAPASEQGSPGGAFWTAKFTRDGVAGPERLRVYWAWRTTGGWQAPDHPRLTFAGAPALHKLYVVHQPARDDEGAGEGPGVEFMRLLLPELQKALFAKS